MEFKHNAEYRTFWFQKWLWWPVCEVTSATEDALKHTLSTFRQQCHLYGSELVFFTFIENIFEEKLPETSTATLGKYHKFDLCSYYNSDIYLHNITTL